MVMRNRGEESGTPHWWDDLPPKVRDRFHQPLTHDDPAPEGGDDAPPPVSRGELVADLSRLAVLFVLVALGNIAFLFVALAFVNS